MTTELADLAAKLDALDLWSRVLPYHWALKPRGVAFPYFVSVQTGERKNVKTRLLFLEGWQTFQDYVRARIDPTFGFCSTPLELPHFELVYPAAGAPRLFRYDVAYMPREIVPAEEPLCRKLLWETYGMLLRVESDASVPLKFAGEESVFARVEDAQGNWTDAPLAIAPARPHSESVVLPKDLLKRAKELPFAADEKLDVDFRLLPNVMTQEPRPRCVYELVGVSSATGRAVFSVRVSPTREGGLRPLWEGMPSELLRRLVALGRLPGEIRVCSARVFRLLRPLVLELPFKLSLHDRQGS